MTGPDPPFDAARLQTLALALACAGASLAAAPLPEGAFGAALALAMAAVADSDRRRLIIPDLLSFGVLLLGLARVWVSAGADARVDAFADAGLRALVCGALLLAVRMGYAALRGRPGLGLGDVKLGAVAGLWLGWSALPLALETAALSALALHVAWPWLRRAPVDRDRRLPFGAFMALAIWLGWLFEALAGGGLSGPGRLWP